MNPLLSNTTRQKKSLNNLLIIKGFTCDSSAIQTNDLQNLNLTLYSLSFPYYQHVKYLYVSSEVNNRSTLN
ncbi:hypothetical protein, partial [Bacteroides acidifaciens]|uniref:hypothetical protein n=1 Tax=Bacteroides acidifaciens TaxID=85831 RepID=UPI00258DCD90